jgi:prefoldin subunit 2
MWNKITELSMDATEHELVISTLEPLDKARKCFRLVGDVLVERTVGETLPAVLKNKQNLEEAISALEKAVDDQKKDLSEFQAKYKITVSNKGPEAPEPAPAAAKPGPQGVLA